MAKRDGELSVRVIPGVCSSRPCTHPNVVPVFVIIGRFRAGESIQAIANDFEIPVEEAEDALRYGLEDFIETRA